jgi:hypothetical protein
MKIIVNSVATNFTFLFAHPPTDRWSPPMTLDAEEIETVKKWNQEFMQTLRKISRVDLRPLSKEFSVIGRPGTRCSTAKVGAKFELEGAGEQKYDMGARQVELIARHEMTLDLTPLYQYLEELFASIVLPEGVRPLVMFERDPFDSYKIIDQICNNNGVRGCHEPLLLFYLSEKDGRAVAVRAMKNSQNPVKLVCSVNSGADEDSIKMTMPSNGTLSQKGVDLSLKPLASFFQGFAQGLDPHSIERIKKQYEASRQAYIEAHKNLYGTAPEALTSQASEPHDDEADDE